MHTLTFFVFFVLTLTWSEIRCGKVVADLRWKETDSVKSLLDKEKVKFLIFGEKKDKDGKEIGNKIEDIFKFSKSGKGKFQDMTMKINDKSLFEVGPEGDKKPQAFRRTDVLVKYDAKTIETGVKIYHHSLKLSESKPMNVTHEYKLASLEDPSNGKTLYYISYGTDFTATPSTPGKEASNYQLRDINRKVLITKPASSKKVSNFAIEIDVRNYNKIKFRKCHEFTAKTILGYYSEDNEPLKAEGTPLPISAEGAGIFGKCEVHAQLIKFPMPDSKQTLEEINRPDKNGIQPTGIDEEVIHSRYFVEEGPITTDPDGPPSDGTITPTNATDVKPPPTAGENVKNVTTASTPSTVSKVASLTTTLVPPVSASTYTTSITALNSSSSTASNITVPIVSNTTLPQESKISGNTSVR
ncbi:hypothetical protein CROQUDRAFT_135903 [Cronartium quercuum f. sp. fusiforme G11]|uniref:Glycoside hydrolase 131 catalytic N-terminal domain-containing protein n=1 Tax=Cronartium quercuum f. sp. fusiforme G11 TaxID=708437 RepID=A0A9P6NCT9_9BASI|nr:hypothetical protein CROQUDRAFT_135903 [Cronartium quercuum f. sp. fusiforme G11]